VPVGSGTSNKAVVDEILLTAVESACCHARDAAGRKASTIAQYRNLTKRYLTPHLGHVKLSDLRATHVEKMLASMETEGRGLVTRRRTVAVLSSALGSAVKRRLIPWNVCSQIEQAPERSEPRPVWDAAQARQFLASVQAGNVNLKWPHRAHLFWPHP
jgi:hypothetical protein